MKKLLVAAVPIAAFTAACFLPRYTARWPYRGPMIEVVNPSQHYVSLAARDGQGRELSLGTVAPRSKACRTWPFIDSDGQLLTANRERTEDIGTESEAFTPWAFHGWRWTIGGGIEAAQVCGT